MNAGVDIGGTKCLGVVLDDDTHVVAEHRRSTPRTGPALIATVVEVIHALRGECAFDAVGVGAPGLVSRDGCLRFAPNLPGVVELRMQQALEAALPDVRVTVDNDATCAAVAEASVGAARGGHHVLMVTIGTGIGGGFVDGGHIQRGHNGFAGEIGHMVVDPGGPLCPCGQRGCWERYASGAGLGWMAREAAQAGRGARMTDLAGGDPEAVRGEHVTIAAGQGDGEAQQVIERFAWWVGLGLANLANLLDPEVIVLGGGIVETGDVVLEPVRRAFQALLEGARHRPPIAIVGAALGERAGAVGAALISREA